MKTFVMPLIILFIATLSTVGCSSSKPNNPYSSSSDEQKARAKDAQKELSREVSKY